MTPFEYARLKRIQDNNKRISALNLPILAQSLVESSSATKKPSSFVKGRSRFVQPGALEAASKKRLRSHDLPQAPPPPTHVTPPPAPIQETYPLTSKVTTPPTIVQAGLEDRLGNNFMERIRKEWFIELKTKSEVGKVLKVKKMKAQRKTAEMMP